MVFLPVPVGTEGFALYRHYAERPYNSVARWITRGFDRAGTPIAFFHLPSRSRSGLLDTVGRRKKRHTGVSIFFVISGFLITTLLLREGMKTGGISLGGFYFRRAFRILPAFLTFVAAMALLAHLGFIHIARKDLLTALTFTADYTQEGPWNLGHLWSLSVEEQFYVIWPLLMVLCTRRFLIRFAIAIIALEPFIRLATRHFLPSTWGMVQYMGHTRADMLMCGCLGALLFESARFRTWLDKAFAQKLPVFAAGFVLLASPLLQKAYPDFYLITVGYTIQAVSITLVLLYVVLKPDSRMARPLNHRLIAHVGILSYGLYLWQQPFFGPGKSMSHETIGIAFACLLAFGSYRLIETPMLNLRSALSARQAPESSSVTVGA
jgi:peptidoglycan/LPS O-acetylase OafA/YrhL